MAVVLVVDNAATNRQKVGVLLASDGGFQVHFARTGREALDQLDSLLPDIVVTALAIPDMDGVELVSQIKNRYPLLPVVLLTSKGTEALAIKALHHGATSYVPKRLLASVLALTLRDVLAAASREGGNARLMGCLTKDECSFVLPSEPELVASLVSYLQQRVIAIGVTDESERMRVAVALEEALVNALYHGNLELSSKLREDDPADYERLKRERCGMSPYKERRIFVEAELSRQALVFVIRDEGRGFDPKKLPDPTEPANLERVSGRGVFLMRTFMDEVRYNETGNEVTLIKRRQ